MTADQVAAVTRDIDATILYWRNTGICIADAARELRCSHSWAAVRATMIAWALAHDAPARLAA